MLFRIFARVAPGKRADLTFPCNAAARSRPPSARGLRLEPLEERSLLAVSVVGGTLNITPDAPQTSFNDVFRLVRDAADQEQLEVFVGGALQARIPLASIQKIAVSGGRGDDSLIVDSSHGLISVLSGIYYDGGEDFDQLELRQTGGLTLLGETYSVGPGAGSGSSILVGIGEIQTVRFDNIEPVFDFVPAPILTVTATPEANAINYTAGSVPTSGRVTVDNYEFIEFSNKTTLVIDSLPGNDVVNLHYPTGNPPTGLTRITVNGNEGDDVVTTRDGVLVDVTFNGGPGNDELNAAGVTGVGNEAMLNGNGGDDLLEGGPNNDVLNGGPGEDVLIGGAGNNTYDGGTEFDTLLLRGTSGSDVINADQTSASNLMLTLNTVLRNETLVLAGLVPTVEELRIDARAGDDVIRVSVADVLANDPAKNSTLRFDVHGGPAATRDRLAVVDDGPGDLVLYRKGENDNSGSIAVGLNASVVFDEVEYAEVTPLDSITGGTGLDLAGRLVVFPHDSFELNNSLPTATLLGSNAIIGADPTIDPGGFSGSGFELAGDEDWYRVVVTETGTLDFQVLFKAVGPLGNARPGLPDSGNLDIEVYDSDGLIAGSGIFGNHDANDDARVRIPAVQGQTYFLRVYGAGAAINQYQIKTNNSAPPVPYDIELDDTPVGDPPPLNSDTGRSQFDNVTRDNTPTILLRVDDAILLNDLPGNAGSGTPPDEIIAIGFNPLTAATATGAGFRVAIFDETDAHSPVPLGFATPSGQPGVYEFTFPSALDDGSHFITARLQMIDPASPAARGFGGRSDSLEIIVDTSPPPVFFGAQAVSGDGLDPESDSGVAGQPVTFTDRITSVTTPRFFGTAEANAIVRLYADLNGNGQVEPSDALIGQTVAIPLDGTNQFPAGQWLLESTVDFNDQAFFQFDGTRRLLITAEDLAGNMSTPAQLSIFVDTQGPQVSAQPFVASDPSYDLLDPKPSSGPTPLIFEISIPLRDLANRDTLNFPGYAALLNAVAQSPGHFVVRGDHNGIIPISQVTVNLDPDVNAAPATATITLGFDVPLPDDRYTLNVADLLVDPAGNAIDGESNAQQPLEVAIFPSGDLQPGGDFVARFTVDSRPEVGATAAGSIFIDINGNYLYDAEGANNDFTNRDLTFTLGVGDGAGNASPGGFTIHDALIAGNFNSALGGAADGFDKLAAYGFRDGRFRWLVDTNHDGVITPSSGDIFLTQPAPFNINGLPVAGDFDGVATNGDEVGLFDGTRFYLDTNANNVIDSGDQVVLTELRGTPVVGDFDGDGLDDLATWRDDVFYFDLANNGLGLGPIRTLAWGFPGVAELPLAADMDQDGLDDIGLWVPRRSGTTPSETSEWYFLLSNDLSGLARVTGSLTTLNHANSPTPLGTDRFANLGDEFALPIVGNFDPPTSARGLGKATNAVQLGSVQGRLHSDNHAVSGEQWFAFKAVRDGIVSVQLDFEHSSGNVDAHLYDDQLTPLASASVDSDGQLHVKGTVTAGQPYFIRAVGENTSVALQLANSLGNNPCDVNLDGLVTPLDALIVINELNARGSQDISNVTSLTLAAMDTTLDGVIAPLDALLVINHLNEIEQTGLASAAHDPIVSSVVAEGPSATGSANEMPLRGYLLSQAPAQGAAIGQMLQWKRDVETTLSKLDSKSFEISGRYDSRLMTVAGELTEDRAMQQIDAAVFSCIEDWLGNIAQFKFWDPHGKDDVDQCLSVLDLDGGAGADTFYGENALLPMRR